MAPGPFWGKWISFGDALGQFLFLNWAFHATCLLAGGLLLSRLPKLRASARHAVLAASLLLAALSPLLPALPLPTRQQVMGGAQFRLRGSLPGRPGAARNGAASPGAPLTAFRADVRPATVPLGWVLLLAWSAVVGVRLVSLAHGSWSVGKWLRDASPADRDRLYQSCRYALADVPVLESDAVAVPSVVGVGQPCILLPRRLMATLDIPALRHVLLHEEAHARRRDPLHLLLAELCHTALFWHPLASLARRGMETAAEDACDSHVLARGIDGPAYARTLLAVLEQAASVRTVAGVCSLTDGKSELRRRVTQILAPAPRTSPVMATLAGGALLAVTSSSAMTQLGGCPALPLVRPGATAYAAPLPRPAPVRSTLRARRGAGRKSKIASLPKALLNPPVSRPARVIPPRLRRIPVKGQPRFLSAGSGARFLAGTRAAIPRAGRCVVFLLDISSSMKPYQPEARREILERAQRLTPDDAFNVVAFSSEVRQFAENPVSPGEDSLGAARAWLDALPVETGTNLGAGLTRALSAPAVSSVVLFSDGQPSQGVTDGVQLAKLVAEQNGSGARIQAITPGPGSHSGGDALLHSILDRNNGDASAFQRLDDKP
jgi:beta-lactamase regulating signal transducer with metallopeptidase domain